MLLCVPHVHVRANTGVRSVRLAPILVCERRAAAAGAGSIMLPHACTLPKFIRATRPTRSLPVHIPGASLSVIGGDM